MPYGDPNYKPPPLPPKDLYNPEMDTTVKKILERRTQRELTKYRKQQYKINQAKDPHEDLLAPTPRDKSKPKNYKPPDPKLRSLDALFNETELTLDWEEAEIQCLRNQVATHIKTYHKNISDSNHQYQQPPPLPSSRHTTARDSNWTNYIAVTTKNNAAVLTQRSNDNNDNNSRPSTTASSDSISSYTSIATPPTATVQFVNKKDLVRNHTGTTVATTIQSEKRKRWQSIAKLMGQHDGWYGRSYRECRWVWRVAKKRQAKLDARKARDDQEHLKVRVSETMVDAKKARESIYNVLDIQWTEIFDRPWTEIQLHQLENLAEEFPSIMFNNDKRKRWKRIQAEMQLPDRSYKSCQRAYKTIGKLQKKSQDCLDLFDQTRKDYKNSITTYAVNTTYLQNCDGKLDAAEKLISFQRQIDTQLRNVARIVDGTETDYIGRPKDVALLLVRGADPNTSDRGGFSALMAACKYNAVGTIEVLIKYGADMNATDSDGKSAIEHAIEGGAAQAVQFLVRKGAEISAIDTANKMNAPSIWKTQISEQLRLFVESEQNAVISTKNDSKWFRKFEAKHARDKHKSDFGKKKERGKRKEEEKWPPEIGSRGNTSSRGSTARSNGRPPRSSGGSCGSGLPMLLQAPSALEALRLGLEGSRQGKLRVKREVKEKERSERLRDVNMQRPPTHERKMNANRKRLKHAVVDMNMEGIRQSNELMIRKSMELHRASTAVR